MKHQRSPGDSHAVELEGVAWPCATCAGGREGALAADAVHQKDGPDRRDDVHRALDDRYPQRR